MRFARLVFCALLVAASFPARAADQPGPRSGKWAHEGSPLAPSPQVTWGRLPNGVRYALLPHKGVPNSVSLRLIVLSGAMDETPDELGIAHFTEHMAFRGTRHFKADDMKALFQRIGVEYGSDVNANTTWDNTTYALDYRENSPAFLREGLQLFRDIGDGLTFDDAAIVSERRVIFAEMRARDSLSERKMQAGFPVIFRGLNWAQNIPIGTTKTLNSFNHESFARFHKRTYRPDLMVVVAVGDFPVDGMTGSIRDIFGTMAAPSTPLPVRDDGKLDAKLRAGVFRISGIGSAETLAGVLIPPTGKPDTREAIVERQKRAFVTELLSERLRTRVPNVGNPQAEFTTILGYELATASVQVGGPDWAHGILAVDDVLRTTLKNGFDRAEIEQLRTRRLRYARQALDQYATADPQMLGNALTDSITSHTVFVGLPQSQAIMRDWLERASPGDLQATYRGIWNMDAVAFCVAGDVSYNLNAAEVVTKVQQYRRNPVGYLPPPPAQTTLATLKPAGKATEVADRRESPELGAVLVRFGNNVRFNFISNKSEPGLARAVVRVGSGVQGIPARQQAMKEFGLNQVILGGSGRYRRDQLTQVIDEKFLEFNFDAEDRDALTFRGAMASEQVETFLTVVSEYLSQPQFPAYAHDDARNQAANARQAGGTGFEEGYRELTNLMFAGDPRFVWGTPLDYMAVGVGSVRAWLEPQLTGSYVEATVVGDLTEAEAMAAMSKTLGALNQRAAEKKPAVDATPKVAMSAGYKRVEFVGEQNLAMAIGDWPVVAPLKLRDQAALQVLTKILEIRIREQVREEFGLSYGPSAEFQGYEDFDGFAMIEANADCAPNEAERVSRMFTDAAAKLAAGGATEGEFSGALGILKSQFRRSFLNNGFLESVLLRAQERPESLNEAVELRRGLLDQLTVAEINEWARKVLPASNSRTAGLIPKSLIGVFDSARPLGP